MLSESEEAKSPVKGFGKSLDEISLKDLQAARHAAGRVGNRFILGQDGIPPTTVQNRARREFGYATLPTNPSGTGQFLGASLTIKQWPSQSYTSASLPRQHGSRKLLDYLLRIGNT